MRKYCQTLQEKIGYAIGSNTDGKNICVLIYIFDIEKHNTKTLICYEIKRKLSEVINITFFAEFLLLENDTKDTA